MYPIANTLPKNGSTLSDLETNVKSMIRSRRAIAFINHDNGLWFEVVEDVEDPEG